MLRPTEEWKFLVENNGLHPEIDAGYGTWMIKKALMYTVRPPREIPWAFMRLLASDTPFDPHKSTRDKKLLELRAQVSGLSWPIWRVLDWLGHHMSPVDFVHMSSPPQLRDECMTAGTRYFIFTTQRYYLLGRFTPKFDMCHYSRPYKNSDPELFCHMIVHMHRALGVLVGMEEPDGLPAVSRKPSEIGRLFKLHREDGTDDDATIAEPYLSPPSGGWRGKGGSSDAPTGGMPTPAPSLRPSGSSREPLLGVTAPTPVPAPAPKRNSADTHLNVAAPTPARNSSPSPAPIITVSASSSSLAPVPGQAPTVARNPSPMPTTTAANPPPSSGYTPTNFLSSSNLAMHDAQNSAGRPRKTSNEPQPPTRHYPRPPTVLIDGNVQNPEERQYYPSNGQAVPSRSHKTSAHGKP
jgi:hypothetical protein